MNNETGSTIYQAMDKFIRILDLPGYTPTNKHEKEFYLRGLYAGIALVDIPSASAMDFCILVDNALHTKDAKE